MEKEKEELHSSSQKFKSKRNSVRAVKNTANKCNDVTRSFEKLY